MTVLFQCAISGVHCPFFFGVRFPSASDVRCALLLSNGQQPYGAGTFASVLISPKIKARNSLAKVSALLTLTPGVN